MRCAIAAQARASSWSSAAAPLGGGAFTASAWNPAEINRLRRSAKPGSYGRLLTFFGSVNARDVAEAVTAAGFTIERRQVILDRPIKTLGLHPLRVALHPEVIVSITANVAKSTEEAEAQEKAGGFVGKAEQPPADLDSILAEVDAASEKAPEEGGETRKPETKSA